MLAVSRPIRVTPTLALALTVVAVAGCASGLTAKKSSAVGTQTYSVVLTEAVAPGHRSMASASATIQLPAIEGRLCWTFSSVVGLAQPTNAHINVGQYPGTLFVQLGDHYAAHGCRNVTAATVTALDNPSSYFIAIDSPNHPDVISASL
jgi:hypothetical protein